MLAQLNGWLGHIVNFLLISYAHDTAAVKVIGQTVLQDHTWIRISLWNKHSDWIADIHKSNKKMNETISCETTHVGLMSNSSLSLLYVCLTKSNLVSYHFQHSTAATPGFKCSPLEIKYMLFPIFLWLVSHCRRCLDKSNQSIKKEKEKKTFSPSAETKR